MDSSVSIIHHLGRTFISIQTEVSDIRIVDNDRREMLSSL